MSVWMKCCLGLSALLPWYGVWSGSFLYYVMALGGVARVGSWAFLVSFFAIPLLAVLLLMALPATAVLLMVRPGGQFARVLVLAGLVPTLLCCFFYGGFSLHLSSQSPGAVSSPDWRFMGFFLVQPVFNGVILLAGGVVALLAANVVFGLLRRQLPLASPPGGSSSSGC